jgi:hypothetical protein
MLDNGYLYLAATRLSLYRSPADWAMVIEVFGFSPRAGLPDVHVYTFASRLHDRDPAERYATPEAYQRYLAANPHNESRFVFPIEEGPWLDEDNGERVSLTAREITVRGERVPLPLAGELARHSITLEDPPQVQVFELCRWLAATRRDQVLATPSERRVSVLPEMAPLLQLDEWHHPDVVGDARPGTSETFRQLAAVLVTGDVSLYRPTHAPNTHWRHWPDGGRL